jgi:hypothetical protein
MKALNLIAIFLLSIACLQSAHAQSISKEKRLSGRFPANRGKLVIDNRFGKLDINTWDRPEVTVDITIVAKARTAQDAQDLLEKVSITEPGSTSGIYYKTVINRNNYITVDAGFTIDYVIHMPRGHNAQFINRHGDVDIEDVDGKLEIDLSYGALKTGAIRGSDKQISVGYGSARIASIETGTIKASYSKLSIDKAGSIKVSNQYQKTIIGTVRDLDIDQKYGDLDIGSVHQLKCNIQFAGLYIDKLLKSADVGLRYGTGARFDYVGPDVNRINVRASYSNVSFHLDNSANLAGELQVAYGNVRSSASAVALTKSGSGSSMHGSTYQMKMGSGRGDIAVDANYGNILFR